MIKKLITFIAAINIIMIIASIQVKAADKNNFSSIVSVSPVIINVALSPGKVYEYEVKVKNLLMMPLPLQANLENFENTEEDGIKDNLNSAIPSITQWVEILDKDAIIQPKETRIIHLRVTIPKKITIGGYYGVLFLQPFLPAELFPKEINAKIGVLLLANIGISDSAKKAEILSFQTDHFFYEKGPVQFNFLVKNLSLTHFSGKSFLTIAPLFASPQKFEFEEKILLPGKIRSWKKNLFLKDYWHGVYFTQIAVSTGGGNQIISNGFFLAFPITKMILIIVFIAILFFLLKRKQRLKQAFKELFKK